MKVHPFTELYFTTYLALKNSIAFTDVSAKDNVLLIFQNDKF